MMASGGWDRTVLFWDVRVKTPVKQTYGYYIGGQAIDFRGNEVLLGNNKSQNPLRIYDLKADKVRVVPWMLTSERESHFITGVLSCFFTYLVGNLVIKNQVILLPVLPRTKCVFLVKNVWCLNTC